MTINGSSSWQGGIFHGERRDYNAE